MKIITTRSIQLDGKHVEAGQPTEVAKAVAEDAIRRGWAVEAKTTAKAKQEGDK